MLKWGNYNETTLEKDATSPYLVVGGACNCVLRNRRNLRICELLAFHLDYTASRFCFYFSVPVQFSDFDTLDVLSAVSHEAIIYN